MRQFIYQESEKGCGLASLRMAMIEATGDKNYKYMRLERHPPYNLKELQEATAKEGGKLTFSKANSKECINEALSFPCLLLLKENGNDHMVYVPKRKKTKFLIYDPQFGPYWAKIDELKEKWTLISGTIEMFNKRKSPYTKPKIRPSESVVIPLITTLLSCFCIFGAFYFMQNDSNYLISIGLLALYGIFEILGKSLTISSMKKFDETWMPSIAFKRRYLKERYLHYHALKKTLYPDVLTLISSAIFSLSIIVLFSFNNSMFLISSSCIILYTFLSTFIFERKISTKKNVLEKIETNLFKDGLSDDQILDAFKNISNETYKIGRFLSFEKILSVVVVIMAALIPLATIENVSLNYYLLHFGALYALGECLRNFFEYLASKEKREKEVMYFYEYFYKE